MSERATAAVVVVVAIGQGESGQVKASLRVR
jgi:hypothetical protein